MQTLTVLYCAMSLEHISTAILFAFMYGLSDIIVCIISYRLEDQDENKLLGFIMEMNTRVTVWFLK